MRYILALLLPPLAVLFCGKPGQCVVNIIFTICGYVPGIIHALIVVASHKADKRTEKLIRAMNHR